MAQAERWGNFLDHGWVDKNHGHPFADASAVWEMAGCQPSLEAIIRVNVSLARGNRPLGGLTTVSLYRENNAR